MKIQRLSLKQRLKNSGKAAALMLALAVASIAVPVFHFVLVPLFLVLALVMGAMEFRKNIEVTGLEVICEECDTPMSMDSRSSQDLLMKYCPTCNHQVTYRL